jgi:hypothetical protein
MLIEVLFLYCLVLFQKNPELRIAQKKLAEQVLLLVHGGTAVSKFNCEHKIDEEGMRSYRENKVKKKKVK